MIQVRGDGENTVFQIANEINSSQTCPSQRKKCPHSDMLRISPYSVHMPENADQNNSESGHFFRSASPKTFNDLIENTEENHTQQN